MNFEAKKITPYKEVAQNTEIDISSPEKTLADADRIYNFVEKVRKNPSAERLIVLGAKPDDIVVKDSDTEGEPLAGDPPVFRASGDKIICVNHPDLYKPMTPRKFVDYLKKVESKILRDSLREKVGNTGKKLTGKARAIFKKISSRNPSDMLDQFDLVSAKVETARLNTPNYTLNAVLVDRYEAQLHIMENPDHSFKIRLNEKDIWSGWINVPPQLEEKLQPLIQRCYSFLKSTQEDTSAEVYLNSRKPKN